MPGSHVKLLGLTSIEVVVDMETGRVESVSTELGEAALYAAFIHGSAGEQEAVEIAARAGTVITHPNPLGNPPPELADAWERYQHGGEVAPYELRALDEWRGDVAEAAGF